MPQNTTKVQSTWTEKHTKFSIKNRIPRVASNLWQWILSLGKEGTEIEISLKEFQQYVAKHQSKPSALWYIREQLERLLSLRIIHVTKDFGSNWYRIHLRHPAALEPVKKLEKNPEILPKPTLNPHSANDEVNSSSNSLSPDPIDIKHRYSVLKKCGEHGIYFDPFKPTTEPLYEYDMEDIQSALNHFCKRGGHRKIRDPQAWLIDCLANAYWIDISITVEQFLFSMSQLSAYIPQPT